MNLILSLIAFLFLTSCKYFVDSPYGTDLNTSLKDSNTNNILNIKSLGLSNNFKIAFISDTHGNYDDFSAVVDILNQRTDIDFVVHGGDFTNLAYAQEYDTGVKILSRLKVPHLVVVGNHDAISQGKLIYQRVFGDFNFSFNFSNTKFIFWNNCKLEFQKTFNFSWLQNELSNLSGATQVVVVQHINNFAADIFSSDEISEWQNLLTTNPPNLVLNGHLHKFSLSTYSGITFHQTSRVQGKKYSLITFDSGNIYIDFCTGKICTRQ